MNAVLQEILPVALFALIQSQIYLLPGLDGHIGNIVPEGIVELGGDGRIFGGALHDEFLTAGVLHVLQVKTVEHLAADVFPIAIVPMYRIVGVTQSVVAAEQLAGLHIGGLHPLVAAFRHPLGGDLLLRNRGNLQRQAPAAPRQDRQTQKG